MCGFAGIISADPELRRRVPAMTAALAHRGPDGHGLIDRDPIALGHRRLSIIDIEGGAQPMLSEDGSIAVVYNGEIYNFPALRSELQSRGCTFRTSSDTEILLHLYRLMGADLVHRLDGMFAFALWDEPRRRLLLARDHMGQKPLFFIRQSGAFAFASEVKALLAADLVPRSVDVEGLSHYISLRFLPDRHTLFSGIEKLPAGHRVLVEDGEMRIDAFWSLEPQDPLPGNEHDLVEALDDRLRTTVREHLLADVQVGAFLSGGVDSSLITAMAARESGARMPTFAIGVREASFNELPWAARVARTLGTEHHEAVVSADLVRRVPDMIWHMDEPADPFGVGVYLASELAASHVKVVLSGDGGDELFAGYDRFLGQKLAGYLAFIPAPLRRSVLRPAIDRMPESFAYKGLSQKLRWVNEMSLVRGADRYAESMSYLRFTEEAKEELFTDAVRERLAHVDSRAKISAWFDRDAGRDPLERMLFTDLMTRIPDHLLPIVDRMSMAHGLEVRPPMLEHRMVEFAARIPARFKLRGLTLKYLLRQVALRYVEPEVVRRPKQGFGFPLAFWLRDELGGFLRRVVEESRFADDGIFRRSSLERLVEEHLSGKRDHNYRLWAVLNLEMWHRLYLSGESRADVSEWVRESLPGAARP